MRLLLCFMFVMGLSISYLPSNADCGGDANEMDAECSSTCGGSDEEANGCYLPPEPGNECPGDFPNKSDDGICCCG